MLLLQNGRVIDPKSGLDQVMDLVTGNGKILELGNDLKEKYPDARVIDATGLVVAPGLIDVHVHLSLIHIYPQQTIMDVTPSGIFSNTNMTTAKSRNNNVIVVGFIFTSHTPKVIG